MENKSYCSSASLVSSEPSEGPGSCRVVHVVDIKLSERSSADIVHFGG
jgi:hypothetical protein